MFEGGVPAHEQLHQFIAAAASLTPPPPPPPPFDHLPYNNIINPCSNSHHLLLQPQPHIINNPAVSRLHRQSTAAEDLDQGKEESRSGSVDQASWGNDELLALLRIRSTMDNWFPEFTWEHVSRKLAELGFKRSADKCKEKFEQESAYFNNNILADDLHHLYPHHPAPPAPPHKAEEKKLPVVSDDRQGDENTCPDSDQVQVQEARARTKTNTNKKRKRRQRRFEMLKGFCGGIVSRMMAQQEEMHKKLLEEMVKRNDEKIAREEAWKIRETERMNKELEAIATEQASAGERQSEIISFLRKLANSENPSTINPNEPKEAADLPTSSTTVVQDNPTPLTETLDHHHPQPQSPSSSALKWPKSPNYSELGKRWPRDEVLALINLRSSLFSNNNNASGSTENIGQDKDGAVIKAPPLWERISQGMLEMGGYKRSAKRCKEKWENINKYFRKTKDGNKKRSLDSRTCPYFHQLNNLYNQLPPSDQPPERRPVTSPENQPAGEL